MSHKLMQSPLKLTRCRVHRRHPATTRHFAQALLMTCPQRAFRRSDGGSETENVTCHVVKIFTRRFRQERRLRGIGDQTAVQWPSGLQGTVYSFEGRSHRTAGYRRLAGAAYSKDGGNVDEPCARLPTLMSASSAISVLRGMVPSLRLPPRGWAAKRATARLRSLMVTEPAPTSEFGRLPVKRKTASRRSFGDSGQKAQTFR